MLDQQQIIAALDNKQSEAKRSNKIFEFSVFQDFQMYYSLLIQQRLAQQQDSQQRLASWPLDGPVIPCEARDVTGRKISQSEIMGSDIFGHHPLSHGRTVQEVRLRKLILIVFMLYLLHILQLC